MKLSFIAAIVLLITCLPIAHALPPDAELQQRDPNRSEIH